MSSVRILLALASLLPLCACMAGAGEPAEDATTAPAGPPTIEQRLAQATTVALRE